MYLRQRLSRTAFAISDNTTEIHAQRACQERNRGKPSTERHADEPLAFQIRGQPCNVEPGRVVDAAKADHQTPDCARAKEAAPLLEGKGTACCLFGVLLVSGRVWVLPFAQQRKPYQCQQKSERSNEHEHMPPAE